MIYRSLELPLKGVRQYVQSADFFDKIAELLIAYGISKDSMININFKKPLTSIPLLKFPLLEEEGHLLENEEVSIVFSVEVDGKKQVGLALQTTEKPKKYIQDLEGIVFSKCILGENFVECDAKLQGLSPSEIIVAATKRYHRVKISENVKWVVKGWKTPLSLSLIKAENIKMNISTKQKLMYSLIKCDVDGVGYGQIYFGATN